MAPSSGARIDREQWHAGLDVYLLNVVRPARLVAPVMVSSERRRDLTSPRRGLSSPVRCFPTSACFGPDWLLYQAVRDQYAADNVRMNNVLPGWIDSLPAKDERRQSVPMQRYGTSDEIVATIAFLASEGAAYITGQNIRVDGGLMRSVSDSRRPIRTTDHLVGLPVRCGIVTQIALALIRSPLSPAASTCAATRCRVRARCAG